MPSPCDSGNQNHVCDPASCGVLPEPGCPVWDGAPLPPPAPPDCRRELVELVRRLRLRLGPDALRVLRDELSHVLRRLP
jgi:hypothetical protein